MVLHIDAEGSAGAEDPERLVRETIFTFTARL